jgi:hypothetical protein
MTNPRHDPGKELGWKRIVDQLEVAEGDVRNTGIAGGDRLLSDAGIVMAQLAGLFSWDRALVWGSKISAGGASAGRR